MRLTTLCLQYTKSHGDINPLSITPLGPYPDVEEGYERIWIKLNLGKVAHPRVLEAQTELWKIGHTRLRTKS
jgi:putative glutathione S-transferase